MTNSLARTNCRQRQLESDGEISHENVYKNVVVLGVIDYSKICIYRVLDDTHIYLIIKIFVLQFSYLNSFLFTYHAKYVSCPK